MVISCFSRVELNQVASLIYVRITQGKLRRPCVPIRPTMRESAFSSALSTVASATTYVVGRCAPASTSTSRVPATFKIGLDRFVVVSVYET